MSEPIWLVNARKYLGEHEIKGPHHNSVILELLDRADGVDDGHNLQGIEDDETPWCSSFICGVLEESNFKSVRSAWARSNLKFGVSLDGPAVGCIVVFERGPNSGHVGFVVGRDTNNHLLVLGGNQGDAVSIAPFSRLKVQDGGRILGYRWPVQDKSGQPIELPVNTHFKQLPLYDSNGKLSSNEA